MKTVPHQSRRLGHKATTSSRPAAGAAIFSNEEAYGSLFELNPLPMWVCDENTLEFLDANVAALRLYGYSRGEFLRLTAKDIRPSEDVPKFLRAVEKQRGSRVAFAGEWHHRRKNGSLVDVEVVISSIQFEGRDARLVTVNDITARKRTEATLRESEERLRLAEEAGHVGVFDWDLVTGIVVWTPQLEEIFGVKLRKFEKRYENWREHVHPDDVARLENLFGDWMASRRNEEEWEYRFLRDGQVRWMAARGRVFRDSDGKPLRMIGTNIDVTERKQLEAAMLEMNFELEREVDRRTAELKQSNELLTKEIQRRRQLEVEVQQVSEMEQQRLGRNLHDGLGQQLTALRLLSNALEHKLAAKSLPEAADVAKLAKQIEEAVRQTHDLARGLYPVELKSGTIVPALRQLAVTTAEFFKVRCRFKGPQNHLQLDKETARQLYRIAQEAVNNAIKHSDGKNIRIELKKIKNLITLIVQDDGKGFSMKAVKRSDMGLNIMQYRANLLKATLRIKSRRGKGTTVTCSPPPPCKTTP